MSRTCPYCKGPYTKGPFCAPCIRELVAEDRYAEIRDSYYPITTIKKETVCPTTSK